MSEISAVSAGRAAILRNEARNLREQELQNRQRLQQERQVTVDKQARAVQDQLSLDRRRLQDLRDDLNQENASRRFLRAQLLAKDIRATDRRGQDRENDIELELLRARALDFERSLPPLTPIQPTGSQRTPEEIEITRQLAEPDRPPPTGLPPLDDRPPPLTPFEAPAPGVAGIDDFGPAPGVAGIDDFGQAPVPDETEEPSFELQERERALRVSERRTDEVDSQVRQEIDLRLAQDRIDQAGFDPDLPRGTLVDVIG